jgi:hypothetical protein
MSFAMRGRRRYALATGVMRLAQRLLPRLVIERMARGWTRDRALPQAARESFRSWWQKQERGR